MKRIERQSHSRLVIRITERLSLRFMDRPRPHGKALYGAKLGIIARIGSTTNDRPEDQPYAEWWLWRFRVVWHGAWLGR